jgi:hypothetical protein
MDDISRNSDGNPNLLNANANDEDPWLNTNYDHPDNQWNAKNGFVFGASATLFISPLPSERSFVW